MKYILTIAFLLGFLGLFAECESLVLSIVIKVVSLAVFALSGKLLEKYFVTKKYNNQTKQI